jgi:hypothetical protein
VAFARVTILNGKKGPLSYLYISAIVIFGFRTQSAKHTTEKKEINGRTLAK